MRFSFLQLCTSTRLGRLLLSGRYFPPSLNWRQPEELVQAGLSCSRVLMVNEAHHGWLRCIRTRTLGQRMIMSAHQQGVRHLAAEALYSSFATEANLKRRLPDAPPSYLAQSDMRALLETALSLGWTLIAYEANTSLEPPNLSRQASTNWREEHQARNIITALQKLPQDTTLLVWCGNNHHSKSKQNEWKPMGYQFRRLSGINPFIIDQVVTVKFDLKYWDFSKRLVERYGEQLAQNGGSAGVLLQEHPMLIPHQGSDAVILSLDNEME